MRVQTGKQFSCLKKPFVKNIPNNDAKRDIKLDCDLMRNEMIGSYIYLVCLSKTIKAIIKKRNRAEVKRPCIEGLH